MKKAFDQTVRDLKRGVNKKVLKVPSIEQKVLDATSNEPWGPHGTLLVDIGQASRNYHEYQMIMSILWKRLNDTGKNWRHVYKALTVLEYMVAHGPESIIQEIIEHAYQIQTLVDFQYIDSSGRDQGHNVRMKSQSLGVLVNDKERIHEARKKAAANRDKFQNSSAGNMYRPGSHPSSGGYGERYDDRYGSRNEERNGYGGEREYSYKDDGRYGDSYSRDGDRYSRDYEDRYGRDDDYRGRSHDVDGSRYGSRSRSADRDKDYVNGDDGRYSSRGSGARTDDQSPDQSVSGQNLDRNNSEQNLPSYEDAVGSAHSPTHSHRDGETSAVAPNASSPPASSSPAQGTGTAATAPAPSPSAAPAVSHEESDDFDEFDPRFPVAPTTSSGVAPTSSASSLPNSFTDNSLALVPTTSLSSTIEVDTSTNSASGAPNQGFDDPFGHGPFKAVNASDSGLELPQQVSQNSALTTFPGATFTSSGDPNIDMLADIFPLSGHQQPVSFQPENPRAVNQDIPQSLYQNGQIVSSNFSTSSGPQAHQTSFPVQFGHPSSLYGSPAQSGQLVMHLNFSSQFDQPTPQAGFNAHNGQPSSFTAYPNQPASVGLTSPYGNYNMQLGGQNMVPEVSSVATSQQNAAPPAKDKFETKSTVWTDTLSRGLVNLNISGPKTNPLSDIGVDFDALNRKEKRMEKPAATPVTSTVHMAKAMGSGSGVGRAGAGGLRPTSNPMMAGLRPGISMAGYGGMNQQPMGVGMGMNQQPMGVGMGMNMAPNMGIGVNMGMRAQMQQPMSYPPVSAMPGGYNPMMGTGNYRNNPYGGGYR